MRRHIVPLLAVLAVVSFVGVSVARARPYESFTPEEHDEVMAETPGCHASCAVTGARRTCTVKDFDCKAVCTALQECKPDGGWVYADVPYNPNGYRVLGTKCRIYDDPAIVTRLTVPGLRLTHALATTLQGDAILKPEVGAIMPGHRDYVYAAFRWRKL